jgi:MoxR-like ATPase
MVLAGLLYPGYSDGSFELRPKYHLIDEIGHVKPEYQNALLQLMETGILNMGICYK